MNSAKDFLELKMNDLVIVFKDVLCRYEFKSQSDAHYIEINPSEKYDEVSMMEAMAEIMYSFYDEFPTESLVFINNQDGIDLNRVELTVKGTKYLPSWACQPTTLYELDWLPIAGENNYALAA